MKTTISRRWKRGSLYTAALVLLVIPGVFAYVSGAGATPAAGVTSTTYGVGRFEDDIRLNTKTDLDSGPARHFWRAMVKTRKPSDLYILENKVAPGGTFGWHSHPGPSLIIVKSGTATYYLADDRKCRPHVVEAGQGFVDDGNSTHLVRNEGTVDLVTVVASFVPAGFGRRVDQMTPFKCQGLANG
jgi:quercetin dioxygenase-like cupin family protein